MAAFALVSLALGQQGMSPHNLPASIINGDAYTATPAGWVLSHCVYELKTGEKHPSLGKCTPKVNLSNPVLRPNSDSDVAGRPLPPDYDGWLQYTAFKTNDTDGFQSFTGLMSVPDVPEKVPAMLYLFPGLQNIDWIPKVDPEPTRFNPFDIIQPVLQYPGITTRSWGVRSWYVTINEGALMSELLDVDSNDAIVCNMTKLGDESWFIGSKIQSSGKETNQNVDRSTPGAGARLKTQPWAYNTLECYGCDGCGTYPKTPVTFSNLTLTTVNNVQEQIKWLPNPKPAKDEKCHEASQIDGPDKVVISFQ